MMFRHVMVPYDGSDHAKNALNYAKDLVAGDADAKLSVVHAVPSSYMGVDRMGTDGALDGVPYGMLDYEEYQGVVKRVLDEAQKRVAEDLGDALADLGDRAQVEAVAGASPGRCAVALCRGARLRPHRHGPSRPGRHPRHAGQRQLRRAARHRCAGAYGEVAFACCFGR